MSNANPGESGEELSSGEAMDLAWAAMILDKHGHPEIAQQLVDIAGIPMPVRLLEIHPPCPPTI
jgi:hypothetical protein